MSTPVHFSDDRGENRRRWNAYLAEIDREIDEEKVAQTFETDIGRVLEPRPGITIKPGNIHARNAAKEGREDEYIDRMRNRYGGNY